MERARTIVCATGAADRFPSISIARMAVLSSATQILRLRRVRLRSGLLETQPLVLLNAVIQLADADAQLQRGGLAVTAVARQRRENQLPFHVVD